MQDTMQIDSVAEQREQVKASEEARMRLMLNTSLLAANAEELRQHDDAASDYRFVSSGCWAPRKPVHKDVAKRIVAQGGVDHGPATNKQVRELGVEPAPSWLY